MKGTLALPFSAPVVIVIWTLASELSSPGTQALTGAAREALGPEAQIIVKGAAGTPEGSELSSAGQATSVVHLSWDAAEHRSARIVCYLPKTGRWLERQITFSAADPEVERGRTLGFFLASIFIEAGIVAEPARPPAESQTRVDTDQPSSSTPPARRARVEPESSHTGATQAPKLEIRGGSNALALAGSAAFPGTSTGFGVWLNAERMLKGPQLWLGARGELRLGSVSSAQAMSMFGSFGVSARWDYSRPFVGLTLSVRLAAAAAVLSLIQLSPDDPAPDWESRVVPVFELLHPFLVQLGSTSSLLFEAGLEFIPGTTEVYVQERRAAVWPMWSGLGRMGFQTVF